MKLCYLPGSTKVAQVLLGLTFQTVGNCMRPSLRILGLTIYLHQAVVTYSTPSALTDSWKLKWGPSLHSPWAMCSASLGNIFTGSLINGMPFDYSWVCFLLSISTWLQVAVLCQHPVATVLRAMKIAIHKYCARSPWCVDASISWAVLQCRHLPTTPHDSASLLQIRLTREAHWRDDRYAPWHIPHTGPYTDFRAP